MEEVDKAQIRQQAEVQRQVAGHGGVGVVAADVSTDKEKELERVGKEVEQLHEQKKVNQEVTKRLGLTLQEKMQNVAKEQKKLQLVRQELAKLDGSLNRNVDILRKEIEQVGQEEAVASRQYQEIEKAYLKARRTLMDKKQRKTLLTSHLNFIILSNEKAKSEKLQELEAALGSTELKPAPPAPVKVTAKPAPRFRGFADADADAADADADADAVVVAVADSDANADDNSSTAAVIDPWDAADTI